MCIWLIYMAVFGATETFAQDVEHRLAREILDTAGVKGGLVVHLGCGDGELTAALRAGEAYLVHGLDTDAENVDAARRHVRSLGLYGKVSIDRFEGLRLPYADNLVNLVVVQDSSSVPTDELKAGLDHCDPAAPSGSSSLTNSHCWVWPSAK